jgi:hypothetical protein
LAMAMAGITIIRVLWPTASTVGASLNG